MTERPDERGRLCPTRADGTHPLIAHWIAFPACQERQRRNYHKCFACAYRGLAADAVVPRPPEPREPVARAVG